MSHRFVRHALVAAISLACACNAAATSLSAWAYGAEIWESNTLTTNGLSNTPISAGGTAADGSVVDCKAGGSNGIFMPSSFKLHREVRPDNEWFGCQTSVDSGDSVTAWAPGLADGTPIRYIAKMKLKLSLVAPPPDFGYMYLETMVQVEDSRAFWYGPDALDAEQEVTLRTVYDAVVGQKLVVRALMNSYNEVGGNLVNGVPVTGELSLKKTRVILSSPTPGANITGDSGHVYD